MANGSTRRDALARLATWAFGGAAAALGLGPVFRSVFAEGGTGGGHTPGGFLPLGRLDDLSREPREFTLSGEIRDGWLRHGEALGSVWAFRDGKSVRVFSSICPHLGCAVDWDAVRGRFLCPCHASAFGPDGRVLEGPSPRPLDELPVRVEADGSISCRWLRFAAAVPSKRIL